MPTNVDFRANRFNAYVVAVSIGFGMIPLVSPTFFKPLPEALHPLLESGILLAAIVAVALNLFLSLLKYACEPYRIREAGQKFGRPPAAAR